MSANAFWWLKRATVDANHFITQISYQLVHPVMALLLIYLLKLAASNFYTKRAPCACTGLYRLQTQNRLINDLYFSYKKYILWWTHKKNQRVFCVVMHFAKACIPHSLGEWARFTMIGWANETYKTRNKTAISKICYWNAIDELAASFRIWSAHHPINTVVRSGFFRLYVFFVVARISLALRCVFALNPAQCSRRMLNDRKTNIVILTSIFWHDSPILHP